MAEDFKVCILNPDDNDVKRTLVFGSVRPDVYKGELTMSDQRIFLDDTIQTIKNKILIELGLNEVSYKELHLFAYFKQTTSTDKKEIQRDANYVLTIYNQITQNDSSKYPFTHDIMEHFISNFLIDTEKREKLTKTQYTYEDLLDVYKKQPIKKILGRQFADSVNHLFSVNPFQCSTLYNNPDAMLYSTENSVLLDFGILRDSTIYVCLASDVFEYARNNSLSEKDMCSMYYPFLFASDITNSSELEQRKEELKAESRQNIPDDLVKLYETVKMFYDIKTANPFLAYTKEGIIQFDIGIKTDFINLLPLDSIFKNIHATENIPFIKYNPGFRRANMFRLYSKQTYTNGRRKPYLQTSEIIKISKETGKSGEISLYTSIIFNGELVKLFVDFQKDGSLRIHSNLENPLTAEQLEELLQTGLNPVIQSINQFIEPIGYDIRLFTNLTDSFIQIYKLQYTSSLKINKLSDYDLNKYRSCLSSLFTVENSNINSANGAKFRFKRVANFQEMSPIDEFITMEKNNNYVEVEELVGMVAKEFSLDEETAKDHVIKFYTKYTITDNRTNETSGFPVSLKSIASENLLVLTIDNITSIQYIPLLKIYMDSILRIFHSPTTVMKNVQTLCSRKVNFNEVEKKVFDTIILPTEKPVELDETFFKKTIDKEFENDDDDDDMYGLDTDDMYGGAPEINPDGFKLKNPNPFQKRIEDRDPELIKYSKGEKTNQFSRTCRGEVNRQPVMLNEEEKNQIDDTDRANGKFTDWNELLTNAVIKAPDDIKPYIQTLASWNENIIKRKDELLESRKNAISAKQEKIDRQISALKQVPMAKPQFELFMKKEIFKQDDDADVDKKNDKLNAKELFARIDKSKLDESIDNLKVTEADPTNKAIFNAMQKPYPDTDAKFESAVKKIMRAKRSVVKLQKDDAEFQKVWNLLEPMKGSYLSSISLSADPDKQFWYICPRYWSLKENRSLTDEEVKQLTTLTEEQVKQLFDTKKSELSGRKEEAAKQIFILKKDVVALSGKKWTKFLMKDGKLVLKDDKPIEQKCRIRSIDEKTGYQLSFEPNDIKDTIPMEAIRNSEEFFLQPQFIIPYKSEVVPDGAYIYEFAHPEEHFDAKGEYIPHFPGLIKNLKSKYDFPCCFKRDDANLGDFVNVDVEKEKEKEKEKGEPKKKKDKKEKEKDKKEKAEAEAEVDVEAEEKEKEKEKEKENKDKKKEDPEVDIFKAQYTAASNKYPIQQTRWGVLPLKVQDFFEVDNLKCVEDDDKLVSKLKYPCLKRYGVELSTIQSILACFADIYAYTNDDVKQTPTIEEMRKIISDAVTLDYFTSYNNNTLASIFRPDSNTADVLKYKDTMFYKEINPSNESQVKTRDTIINAYENFIKFINDPSSKIDHTYMWDIMTKPNELLFPPDKFPDGINLVIFEINKDSGAIELVCPTNQYSDSKWMSDKKQTLFLIKQDVFYEPVYLQFMEDKYNTIITKLFADVKIEGVDMAKALARIRKLNDTCKPKYSIPNASYKGRALSAIETINELREKNYDISKLNQVVNYQFKTVGFQLPIGEKTMFLPCAPSATINDTYFIFVDYPEIWNDYKTTLQLLMSMDKSFNCIPNRKVMNRNNVIGFLTVFNQFIKVTDSITKEASIEIDNELGIKLLPINGGDYLAADKKVTTNQPPDENRIDTIKQLSIESNAYNLFRSAVRNLLSYYENRKAKLNIHRIIKKRDYGYHEKIDRIERIIKMVTKEDVVFGDVSKSSGYQCLYDKETKCPIELPKKNLINGKDNSVRYFIRIADELVRYNRVRSFIMEPKYYLNVSNVNYKINSNEILLLDSAINSAYLNDTNVFSVNEYIRNITYEIAEPDPDKSQRYVNRLVL